MCIHDDESLHFSWQRSAADQGARPEYEYMRAAGAAGDVEIAADKIARVLRLRDEPAGSTQ